MLKYKRIACLTLMPFVFILLWYFDNIANLGAISSVGNEIYYFINRTNYLEQNTCYLVLTIFYLLMLKNFFLPEKFYAMLREKSRARYYGKRILQASVVSSVFSLYYILVHIIAMSIFFDMTLLLKTHFYYFAAMQYLYTVLFYIRVGIIFYIITDLTASSGISVVMTSILYAMFYLFKLFGIIFFWTPYDDMLILGKGVYNYLTGIGTAFIFLRAIAVMLIFFVIGITVFLRRNFISSEKK